MEKKLDSLVASTGKVNKDQSIEVILIKRNISVRIHGRTL